MSKVTFNKKEGISIPPFYLSHNCAIQFQVTPEFQKEYYRLHNILLDQGIEPHDYIIKPNYDQPNLFHISVDQIYLWVNDKPRFTIDTVRKTYRFNLPVDICYVSMRIVSCKTHGSSGGESHESSGGESHGIHHGLPLRLSELDDSSLDVPYKYIQYNFYLASNMQVEFEQIDLSRLYLYMNLKTLDIEIKSIRQIGFDTNYPRLIITDQNKLEFTISDFLNRLIALHTGQKVKIFYDKHNIIRGINTF